MRWEGPPKAGTTGGFFAGGFDQVRLDRGSDLVHLDELDQKLWVALSCPTRGLEFDEKTLDLIDTDKDGRIRPPEILAAVKWACEMLKNPDDLLKGSPSLSLGAINDAVPEGKQLLASARHILANLGKKDAGTLSIDDTTNTTQIFVQTRLNGDGIVTPDASDDAAVQAGITDMMACVGSETDRSGLPGINKAKLDLFFAEAKLFSEWWALAEKDRATILPLGDATPDAAAAVRVICAKIDDYFARCRLAAFDPPAAQAALNPQTSEYLAIGEKQLTNTAAEIAVFPLVRIEPNRPLPLTQGINPAWAESLAVFRAAAVKPIIGEREILSEAEWNTIKNRFAAFDAWVSHKAGATVEKLGLARVRELLAGSVYVAVSTLIAADVALEAEFAAISALDRLVRYNRDLYKLLNNFVNFRDFYGRRDKAVFQVGRLYLDQRACDLCVGVADMAKHGTMAHLSSTYLAYCDCVRKSTGQQMTIAAAFTAGDSDNLMVGRNGVFYDRKGNDWDATITKVIENPISIREAFWAPYKRVIRWIEDQIAKRAAAADADSAAKLAAASQAGAPAAAASPDKLKIDIGVVAALGVAVGGITAALGVLLQAFFGLGIWMPVGLLAMVLLISGPSMVIAWLKLRQRNLGPILDANAWAVNTRARINIPFGASLTAKATLPKGAQRDLTDPYPEKHTGLKWAIVILLIAAGWAAWNYGLIEKWVPGMFPKSEWVSKHEHHTPTSEPATQGAK